MAKDTNDNQPDPREILVNLTPRDKDDKAQKTNSNADNVGDKADSGNDKADNADSKADEQPTSLRTIIRQRATEDELPLSQNFTLRKILGGDILSAEIIRRQIWVILLAALFVIIYISNRYQCQQNLIKIDKLTRELKDAKYRALSSSSDLTQQTRESMVLEHLRNAKDSTLHIAKQPPYMVTVPANDDN